MSLKWRFPKFILWIALIVILIVPLTGFLWFIIRFNIPFLNSGDTVIFKSVVFIFWLCGCICIFGFKYLPPRH